jgi:hypothetical protein
VTINNVMPKINDFLQGFQDNLPGMKDFRHASRLYIDDNYKLMPKQKFLFYVQFDTDETLFKNGWSGANSHERYELNMLVKACELPKYNMNIEEKFQYNKKMYCATRIQYSPVNITFHDDHADTVNAFWKKYYEYNIADSHTLTSSSAGRKSITDDYYDPEAPGRTNKWGMDTPKQRKKPYLRGITIFVLHKQQFTSMELINPKIASFAHDDMDQADGTGVMANTMQIMYETVTYSAGTVRSGMNGTGFKTIHYDHEPSPLSVLGGGTNSIFGTGGVVDGIGSVMRNMQNGNVLGAILSASNTYNNAKKMKKKDVKAELKGIAKKGILDIGKQAGTISNPIGAFSVGAAIAGGVAIATAKGIVDNKNRQNSTAITNPTIDTVTFLGADEAYNLVTTDSNIRDEIAAGIYYKDIGSRKGLTIAESDIEYSASTDTAKTVYRNKAITDIRKLVTEGYIKINRSTQDVSIATEKAGL